MQKPLRLLSTYSKWLVGVPLFAFLMGCKSGVPDVGTKKTLLSKVEYFARPSLFSLPNSPTDNILKLGGYTTFAYDDQNRLISEQNFLIDSPQKNVITLNRSYSLQYGSNGKISQINDEKFDITAIYIWSASRVTSTRESNGRLSTITYELNEAGLPTRRTMGTSVNEVKYDAQDNITEITDQANRVILRNIEHDVTKFNPYTSSYELRIFFNIFTNEGFLGRSRNWVLRRDSGDGIVRRNEEIIVESNGRGYPTVTKNSPDTEIRYTYIDK